MRSRRCSGLSAHTVVLLQPCTLRRRVTSWLRRHWHVRLTRHPVRKRSCSQTITRGHVSTGLCRLTFGRCLAVSVSCAITVSPHIKSWHAVDQSSRTTAGASTEVERQILAPSSLKAGLRDCSGARRGGRRLAWLLWRARKIWMLPRPNGIEVVAPRDSSTTGARSREVGP